MEPRLRFGGSNASDLPGSGRHEGKQAAIAVLQQAVGAWDKFELSADEFIEQGDTVVVLGHTDLEKGERSERLPVVHIWRFRGDEEICRLQILTDTLQAHGSSASPEAFRQGEKRTPASRHSQQRRAPRAGRALH